MTIPSPQALSIADTRAIRAIDTALDRDTHVDISLIPIAGGPTLAMQRV